MAHDPIVAICDACVLYPFHLRNILIQIAADGLYEARWSVKIHDEWTRNLLANVPSIPLERLQRTRDLMDDVLPAACVGGFWHRIEGLHLPDPDDRHVVAAAIEANASLILTWNLSDFPARALEPYGIAAVTPDVFLSELYDRAPELVAASLESARGNLSRSGMTQDEFLEMLEAQRLIKTAARLQKHPRC